MKLSQLLQQRTEVRNRKQAQAKEAAESVKVATEAQILEELDRVFPSRTYIPHSKPDLLREFRWQVPPGALTGTLQSGMTRYDGTTLDLTVNCVRLTFNWPNYTTHYSSDVVTRRIEESTRAIRVMTASTFLPTNPFIMEAKAIFFAQEREVCQDLLDQTEADIADLANKAVEFQQKADNLPDPLIQLASVKG